MKRRLAVVALALIIILMFVPLLLTQVGQDDAHSPAQRAERYLRALAAGDQAAAQRYVCEQRQAEIGTVMAQLARYDMQIEGTEPPQVSFDQIACQAEGNRVRCTYQVTSEVFGTAATTTITEVYRLNTENLICGTIESTRQPAPDQQAARADNQAE